MKKSIVACFIFSFLAALSIDAKIVSQVDQIRNQDSAYKRPKASNWAQSSDSVEAEVSADRYAQPDDSTGVKYSIYMGVSVGYAQHEYRYNQILSLAGGIHANPSTSTATLSLFPGIQFLFDDIMIGFEGVYIFDKSRNFTNYNYFRQTTYNYTSITGTHVWGVSARVGLQIMPGLIPYLSLGYRQQKIWVRAFWDQTRGVNQQLTYHAIAPAVGVDYMMSNDISLRLQYDMAFYGARHMFYGGNPQGSGLEHDSNKPQVSTLSMGIAYHF